MNAYFKSKIKDLKLDAFTVTDMGQVTPDFAEALSLGLEETVKAYLAENIDFQINVAESQADKTEESAVVEEKPHPFLSLLSPTFSI